MAKQLVFKYEVAGKERTFNFGNSCWEIFCEKMQVGPSDIAPTFQDSRAFKAMRTLVYSAITATDRLANVPDSVTEVEVANWVNDGLDVMLNIFEAAMSTFYGMDVKKVTDEKEDDQKKSRSRSKK